MAFTLGKGVTSGPLFEIIEVEEDEDSDIGVMAPEGRENEDWVAPRLLPTEVAVYLLEIADGAETKSGFGSLSWGWPARVEARLGLAATEAPAS